MTIIITFSDTSYKLTKVIYNKLHKYQNYVY